MITVVIGEENISLDKIILNDKNDINHLKNSFRVKEGDEVRAVDGKNEYICEVSFIEKKEMILDIKSTKEFLDEGINITAGISLLKNDKMELVIQKLTEIGIDEIIPVETKRTIVKLKEKKDKWDVISREAVKQCQRTKFLEIANIKKIQDLDLAIYDAVLVPYENEENYSLKDYLKEERKIEKNILYLIGPEGGFDKEEIEYLKAKANISIVTLGKNILRAETAAIVVGGILINEFK